MMVERALLKRAMTLEICFFRKRIIILTLELNGISCGAKYF
jgi:hypothetical protein